MTDVVWALEVDDDLDAVNVHVARLEAVGLLGLSEERGRTTVWLPHRRYDLPVEGRWRQVPAAGWHERWQATVEPVRLGSMVVVPPWLASDDPDVARTQIVIEPAQAFGTGHHETTARCAVALETSGVAGRTVLDVGTGTGILAVVAHRLGAGRVVACDTDPLAVAAARRTAAVNTAAVEVVEGSLDALGDLVADVVVANLDTATVVRMAEDLVARCADRLLVSGISNERTHEACAALEAAGADRVAAAPGQEWALVTAAAPAGASTGGRT